MTTSSRPAVGAPFPPLSWPRVGGGRLAPAQESGWRVLVVYRGKHCGLCREYLGELQRLRAEMEAAGFHVAAVSADPHDKAATEARDEGWQFPLAYDLPVEDMRTLGLYVSPAAPPEADRPFAEPAVFVLNPDGALHVANIANAPFSRPDLRQLFEGLQEARRQQAPVHGTF